MVHFCVYFIVGGRYGSGISLKWKHQCNGALRWKYVTSLIPKKGYSQIGSLWQHIWLVYFEWHFRCQFQISYSNKNELMFARQKALFVESPTIKCETVMEIVVLWKYFPKNNFTSFKNITKGWYFHKTDLILKIVVQNASFPIKHSSFFTLHSCKSINNCPLLRHLAI